jgi:hypothetical protein
MSLANRRRLASRGPLSKLPVLGVGAVGCGISLIVYGLITFCALYAVGLLFQFNVGMLFGKEYPFPVDVVGGVIFTMLGGCNLWLAVIVAFVHYVCGVPAPFFH